MYLFPNAPRFGPKSSIETNKTLYFFGFSALSSCKLLLNTHMDINRASRDINNRGFDILVFS